MKYPKSIVVAGLFLLAGLVVQAGVTVTVGHLGNDEARPGFQFSNIPTPAITNAARQAQVVIVDGERDPAGGDVDHLTDGQLPGQADLRRV